MDLKSAMEIDIEIDELTDCIYDRITNERFDTEFRKTSTITKNVARRLQEEGWLFDWSIPQDNGYDVYVLNIIGKRKTQGMIAIKHFTGKGDGYTHVSLVESSPVNRGYNKQYIGVGGNLFAIACKLSFDVGNDGYVQFTAKTDLVEHYRETLHAKMIDGQRMYIDTQGAAELIRLYLKEDVL